MTETRSSAPQVGEVQRGHQRHHRRRRRLVAADLERVALRPLAVRVVDDPHREPEHTPLDPGQRVQIRIIRCLRLTLRARGLVGASSTGCLRSHVGSIQLDVPAGTLDYHRSQMRSAENLFRWTGSGSRGIVRSTHVPGRA